MTRKEIVKRSVHFQNPPRLPRYWFYAREDDSDAVMVHLRKWYEGPNANEAELGFRWVQNSSDNMTMGVPEEYPLKDWDNFEYYVKNILPDPYDPNRFAEIDSKDFGDRYVIGDLYLSGFTAMWLLRSFDEVLYDMAAEPEQLGQFADMLMENEMEIIKQCPAHGIDCIGFADDIGMQTGMMMSPEMWRKHFKERLRKQFDLCHELGMDVYFHTCGYVAPVLEDLVEIGVDIFDLGQIYLNDVEEVSRKLKGKVCFAQPIDYQTVGLSGTKEEIYAEAKFLLDKLFDETGGVIAKLVDYEDLDYKAIPGNTELTRNAFVEQDPLTKKH